MNYGKYAAKAQAKLEQYGSPCAFVRAGKKTYDPDTDEYADAGERFEGYALETGAGERNIDGTNVRFNGLWLMCSVPQAPQSNDAVEYGGRTYTVVDAKPFSPDGRTVIYWTVQAR